MRVRSQCLLLMGLLIFAGVSAAQSVADMVRQNSEEDKPKAKRVITNDDLPAGSYQPTATRSVQKATAPRTSVDSGQPSAAEIQTWRNRVAGARQHVGVLESELRDLETERTNRNRNARYGDPSELLKDPTKRQEEMKLLVDAITAKRKELTQARTDLEDELNRARKAGFAQYVK